MPDTQPDLQPSSGSVPHSWGNVLARRWARELPRPLTGPFLTCLYALRQLASANGELRYMRDGKGVTIQEIAAASRSNEKDTRRYLTAAIAAGIIRTVGERKRGRATVYALLTGAELIQPNWAAAVTVLENTRPRRAQATAPPWHTTPQAETSTETEEESSGHQHPNSTPEEFGSPTPELPAPHPQESSGHRHPLEFGSPSPADIGSLSPDHPGSTHELPHDEVAVGPQPEGARARGHTPSPATAAEGDPDPPAPSLRPVPDPPLGSRARRQARTQPPGQAPLLLAVPGDPEPAVDRERRRAAAADDPGLVRTAVRQLGHREAVDLYGRRLVWAHAADLIHAPAKRTS